MVRRGGLPVGNLLRTQFVANLHPLGRGYSTLEFSMNIELDEVVVLDVSDEALELAVGGVEGGFHL